MLDSEAERIAAMYLRRDADRSAVLNPGVGVRGEQLAPLAAGELNTASEVISAMGLDRSDATIRLDAIRAWLLSDPTFERDLWGAIRYGANKGSRHCMNAILRLVYGWQENDNIAEKLGATLDEAKRALNTTSEVSRMTIDDLIDAAISFTQFVKEHYPDKWAGFCEAMGVEPK
jgi:hypothetical protein